MKQEYTISISSKVMRTMFTLYHKVFRKTLLEKQLPHANKKHYVPTKGYRATSFDAVTIYSSLDDTSDVHVFFLHGGAYVLSGQSFHIRFLSMIQKQIKCNLHYVDYPLAPTYTVDETVSQTKRAIEVYCDTNNINTLSFIGDSAGAGLALVLANEINSSISVEHLFLLSPWLDLTVEDVYDTKDPILSRSGLQQAALMYAPHKQSTTIASPIFYKTLPVSTVSVYTSTNDILHQDALRLYDKYPNNVELHVFHGGLHDFPIFPYTKEQNIVVKNIVATILDIKL